MAASRRLRMSAPFSDCQPESICYTSVVLIAISAPADNERTPQYVEQMLDAIYRQRSRVSFELGRHDDTVTLYCRFSNHLQDAIESQLRSAYPDARVTEVHDDALKPPKSHRCFRLRLRFRSDVYCVKWWQRFFDSDLRQVADPIAGILTTLANEELHTHVAIETRPATLLRRTVFMVRRKMCRRCDQDGQKPPGHLFAVGLRLTVAAPRRQSRLARRKRKELAAAFGSFENPPYTRLIRVVLWPRTFLLSTPELATLWHPPMHTVRTDRMKTTPYRRLEPPAVIPIPSRERGSQIAVLGRVNFHGRNEACGIQLDDRMRHLYVIGKTGMGKTTLMESQALSDIDAGHGVIYIDPHGDSAEKLADAIPKRRTNDAIYFDPADRDHPIGLNVLHCPKSDDRPMLASEIVSILQHIYGIDPSNAPRLLDITRNALLALMEVPGTTLLSLVRMLGDRGFRDTIVRQVSDPLVRNYWEREFGQWKPTEQTIAVASVQNKLRPFVMDYRLRAMLGQEKNRLDLRKVMDEGKVLIVNLSKGKIGEDTSALLGSLLVTKMQLAAMSRADIPERKRRPFFGYVDEFQNFATESFATILSEARKYRVALTVANQYIAQLEQRNREVGNAIKAAVFGNVGSIVAFQVGADDSNLLAEEFGGGLTPEDLTSLPKYIAYVRLLVDGMRSRPFSIQTLKPDENERDHRLEVVRRTSRNRYGQPIEKVQQEVERTFQLSS